MPQDGKIPGNAPNQFAQVGMGGSQGGGQFEQGEGQSGSLQDQQGGTTTTRSVPLGGTDTGAAGGDIDPNEIAQQEQAEPRAADFDEEDDSAA